MHPHSKTYWPLIWWCQGKCAKFITKLQQRHTIKSARQTDQYFRQTLNLFKFCLFVNILFFKNKIWFIRIQFQMSCSNLKLVFLYPAFIVFICKGVDCPLFRKYGWLGEMFQIHNYQLVRSSEIYSIIFHPKAGLYRSSSSIQSN